MEEFISIVEVDCLSLLFFAVVAWEAYRFVRSLWQEETHECWINR